MTGAVKIGTNFLVLKTNSIIKTVIKFIIVRCLECNFIMVEIWCWIISGLRVGPFLEKTRLKTWKPSHVDGENHEKWYPTRPFLAAPRKSGQKLHVCYHFFHVYRDAESTKTSIRALNLLYLFTISGKPNHFWHLSTHSKWYSLVFRDKCGLKLVLLTFLNCTSCSHFF